MADWYLWGPNNDYIESTDGSFKLMMQTDCNLVLYRSYNSSVLWASNTNGQGSSCWAMMQEDGNLVIYKNLFNGYGQAIWATGTNGHPGAYLVAQGDGNLVVYQNRTPLWATNTVLFPALPSGMGGTNGHPGCQFSRTETTCYAFVMTCKQVWACGWDYTNQTVIEQSDPTTACGACFF